MWCDERSIHSTAERGLSASLSAPLGLAWHAHRPTARSARSGSSLRPRPTVACSPTASASSRSSHPSLARLLACLLACLCLLLTELLPDCPIRSTLPLRSALMLACLLAYWLTVAHSFACSKIFPCLWLIRFHGAGNGSQTVSGISPYTHAMPTAMTAMATGVVSGRLADCKQTAISSALLCDLRRFGKQID